MGNFYYTVMHFGLKNAGTTYQRAMTAIFHDMMHGCLEDDIDDIVVKSKEVDQHIDDLKRVFNRCRKYKLRMNPLKCSFGVSSGRFLGFTVHRKAINLDAAKAKAIRDMEPPKSTKQLKSFLGRVSYKRRHSSLGRACQTVSTITKKGYCIPMEGRPTSDLPESQGHARFFAHNGILHEKVNVETLSHLD